MSQVPKPSKRQPIVAKHRVRTVDRNGKKHPFYQRFTKRSWEMLPTLRHEGKNLPNYGFVVVDRFGEDIGTIVEPEEFKNGNIETKSSTESGDKTDSGTVGTDAKKSAGDGDADPAKTSKAEAGGSGDATGDDSGKPAKGGAKSTSKNTKAK